jgi:tetratricopeptide (TPR) repeat protein
MSKPTSTHIASKSSEPLKTEAHGEETQQAGNHNPEEPRDAKTLFRKVVAALPAALAFLFSLNTLWNEFVADDAQQVLNNFFIKDWKNLPLAFTTSVWSFATTDIGASAQPYYRPFFSALFTLNYVLFGTASPFGWHLVNILIHTAVTWLVYVVCKELTQNRRLALLTAILFAVHPAHTESVAWISGVTDPLMALFLLPSFYFYLVYRRSGKPYHLALTLLLFLCALWSKETAFALPVILAYCEIFYFKDSAPLRQRLNRLAILAALFVAPVVIYIATRYQAFNAFLGSDDLRYPLSAALKTMPLAAAKYLWLVSVPLGLSYQHDTPFVTSIASWQFLAPLALLAVFVGALIWSKSRLLKFAGVWFFALLMPALAGIVSFDPAYLVQERYLYLPVMGFCLAVALGIEWVASRQRVAQPERLALAVSVAFVLLYGTVYAWHNRQWHDTVTMFRRVVAAAPDSAYAHAALSGVYAASGRPREAEQESKKALELDPQCLPAYSNLSFFSTQAGKLDEAIAYLEQAKSAVPLTPVTRTQLSTVHLNLGLLYSQRKDFERAEQMLQESNALWSRTSGYYYTGQYYYAQKRYEEALPYYETVLHRLPKNYAPIRLSIGALYEQLGQTDKAIASYNKYLELAPGNAPDRDQVFRRIKQLQPQPPTK